MPQLLLNAIAGYAILNSGKGKLGWLWQQHYGHTSLYVPLSDVLLVVVERSSQCSRSCSQKVFPDSIKSLLLFWVFDGFFPRDTCEIWLGSNLHSYNLIVLHAQLLLNAIAEHVILPYCCPSPFSFLTSPLTFFVVCLLALSPYCLCLTFLYFHSVSLPRVISPLLGAAGFLRPKVFTFQVTSLFRYWICHLLLTFNV